MLKGGDSSAFRGVFQEVVGRGVGVVALEAADCAGDADSAGCPTVSTCTADPVLSLHCAGPCCHGRAVWYLPKAGKGTTLIHTVLISFF